MKFIAGNLETRGSLDKLCQLMITIIGKVWKRTNIMGKMKIILIST